MWYNGKDSTGHCVNCADPVPKTVSTPENRWKLQKFAITRRFKTPVDAGTPLQFLQKIQIRTGALSTAPHTYFLCMECANILANVAKLVKSKEQFMARCNEGSYLWNVNDNSVRQSGATSKLPASFVDASTSTLRVATSTISTSTPSSTTSDKYTWTSPCKTSHIPKQNRVAKKIYLPVKKKSLPDPVKGKVGKRNLKNQLQKTLEQRQYARMVRLLYRKNKKAQQEVRQIVKEEVKNEIRKFVRNQQSIHRKGDSYQGLENFTLGEATQELYETVPTLYNVLDGVFSAENRQKMNKTGGIGVISSIIAFSYRPRTMNAFQRCNSAQLWLTGCPREIFQRFRRIGVTCGKSGTTTAIDDLRKGFDKEVKDWKGDIEKAAGI